MYFSTFDLMHVRITYRTAWIYFLILISSLFTLPFFCTAQDEPEAPSAPVVPVGEAAYSAPSISVEQAKLLEELEYATQLMNYGLAEYAKMILDRMKDKGAGPMIKVIELQSLISLGKWDQVKAKIAAEPNQEGEDAWAMRLTLADGYYAWGKYAEAQEIYKAFFNKYPSGPPEALKKFYFDSAYKFAQMMLQIGNKVDAIMAYDRLLASKPERAIERQILSDKCELMLSMMEDPNAKIDKAKYKSEIEAIIKKLMWVQDLWFAKSIVYKAHLKVIEGDFPGAMKVLDDFRSQLEDMDRILKEEELKTGHPFSKMSPMAQCRYLMGKMLQERAEKLDPAANKDQVIAMLSGQNLPPDAKGRVRRTDGALQHFFEVFVNYPNTAWAPDAGTRMRKVQDFLELNYNAKINMKVPDDQWAKVEKMGFEEARTLFRQNQFEPASVAYIKVLNLFPEGETAVAALGELARCYIELKDELMMEVVVSYLSERFGKNKEYFTVAGDKLLELQGYLKEIGATNKSEWVTDLFFDRAPLHPRVPAMIMRRGDDKYILKDYEAAMAEYNRIETGFTETPFYLDALNRKAICLQELGKTAEFIKTLEKYAGLREKKDDPESVKEFLAAKYRLGNAFRQLEPPKYVPNAMKFYGEIINMVSDEKHPKNKVIPKGKDTDGILEGALFNEALCYSMLKEPAENEKAYKARAVKGFEDLIKRFPKSEYAPSALLRLGTLYTIQGNSEEASKAFERLAKDFPESQPAKNVAYLRGMALLNMGKRDEAMRSFKDMFGGKGGTYSDGQILDAAMNLLEEKEYEIALEGLEKIKGVEKKEVQERGMLGRGKALQGLKRSAEAIAELEAMMAKYPQSGFTPEVASILATSYGDVAMEDPDAAKRFDYFNKAVLWLKKMKRFDNTQKGQRTVELKIGRINKKKAQAEEKFGTKDLADSYKGEAVVAFHTIMQFADAKDVSLKDVIGEAYAEALPLMMEMEKWLDVKEACDKYASDFPNGKLINEIRSMRNKANVKLASEGAPAVQPGATPEEPVPEEDTTTPPAEGGQPEAGAVDAAVPSAPAAPAATTTAPEAAKPAAPAVTAPAAPAKAGQATSEVSTDKGVKQP